jgi:hypothetical protein
MLDKKNMAFNKNLSQIYARSCNYLQYTGTLPGTMSMC